MTCLTQLAVRGDVTGVHISKIIKLAEDFTPRVFKGVKVFTGMSTAADAKIKKVKIVTCTDKTIKL